MAFFEKSVSEVRVVHNFQDSNLRLKVRFRESLELAPWEDLTIMINMTDKAHRKEMRILYRSLRDVFEDDGFEFSEVTKAKIKELEEE